MSFILPLAILGSSGFGFVAGYIYNNSNTETKTNINNITEKDLMYLKEQSPHKDIHKELVEFDKNKLKKVNSSKNIVVLSEEQEMIEKLREKILDRRYLINNEHIDLPIKIGY